MTSQPFLSPQPKKVSLKTEAKSKYNSLRQKYNPNFDINEARKRQVHDIQLTDFLHAEVPLTSHLGKVPTKSTRDNAIHVSNIIKEIKSQAAVKLRRESIEPNVLGDKMIHSTFHKQHQGEEPISSEVLWQMIQDYKIQKGKTDEELERLKVRLANHQNFKHLQQQIF